MVIVDLRLLGPEYYVGSVTRVQKDAVSAEPLELKSGWVVEQAILAEEEPLVLVVIRFTRQGGDACMQVGTLNLKPSFLLIYLYILTNNQRKKDYIV